ncbi:MAG: RluA family pseudouridine synthase [Chromatiales bacterium]
MSYVRVDEGHAGRRIDNLLNSLLADVPKSHIYRMLRRGEVRLNGRRVRPEVRVEQNDILRLPPLRSEAPTAGRRLSARHAEDLRAMVLYEDERLLVVNKPAGMAVHGGSGLRFGLIETLRAARPEAEFLELVHRLDRDTSGCLIIAKGMRALRQLHDALRAGGIGKRYLLLARGQWRGGERRVDEALRKNGRQGGERMVRVDPDGKPAVTWFRLKRQFPSACLLEAETDTGRTHQIRVHAACTGFPIAGDSKYGERSFTARMRGHGLHRLFLHAARVEIPCGNNEPPLVVEAPLPKELGAVVESLAMATACDNSC